MIRRHRATQNIVIVKVTSRWTSACTVRYVAAIIVTQQHDLSVFPRSYTVYRGVGASPLKSYFRRIYVRKVLRVQICLISEYSLSSIYSLWKGALYLGRVHLPRERRKCHKIHHFLQHVGSLYRSCNFVVVSRSLVSDFLQATQNCSHQYVYRCRHLRKLSGVL